MAITAEQVQTLIDRVANGESLNRIFADAKERIGFYDYLSANVAAQERYARAQQIKAEFCADDILVIADNPDVDPGRARNQIDARKWYAAKMQPQKYGERLDLNVTQTVDIKGALTEARARALPARDLRDIEDAQVVEHKQLSDNGVTGSEPVVPKNPNDSNLPDIFK